MLSRIVGAARVRSRGRRPSESVKVRRMRPRTATGSTVRKTKHTLQFSEMFKNWLMLLLVHL